MLRRNEDILFRNFQLIKNGMVEKYNIVDESYLSDIELIIDELLEFGCYIDFDVNKYKIFCEKELEEFLDFYSYRNHVNCIVTCLKCQEIVNMLFGVNIKVYK